jgi:hypothetical protein
MHCPFRFAPGVLRNRASHLRLFSKQVVATPRWGTTKYENQVQRTRPFRCASGVLRKRASHLNAPTFPKAWSFREGDVHLRLCSR